MSDTSVGAPTPQWWPRRTNVIVSGVLAALAAPLLTVGGWMVLSVVFGGPCDRAAHDGGSDYCGDRGIGLAIEFIVGAYAALIGSSTMIGATVLFRRPHLRWRVLLGIVGIIFGTPIALYFGFVIWASTN